MALDADCYNGLEKQRKEQAVQVLQKWSRSLRVKWAIVSLDWLWAKYPVRSPVFAKYACILL